MARITDKLRSHERSRWAVMVPSEEDSGGDFEVRVTQMRKTPGGVYVTTFFPDDGEGRPRMSVPLNPIQVRELIDDLQNALIEMED